MANDLILTPSPSPGDISLEIFGGSPYASLLGAMIFPNDREKAALYAAHWLATAISYTPVLPDLRPSETLCFSQCRAAMRRSTKRPSKRSNAGCKSPRWWPIFGSPRGA